MSEEVPRFSPSPLGFSRRYLLSALPAILYAAYLAARSQLAAHPWLPPALLDLLAPLLLTLALAASWVLRSPEAAASTLLALALPIPLALLAEPAPAHPLALLQLLAARYAEKLPPAALLASLLVASAVEVRRRTTRYELGEAGVVIRTGVWRRQEQTILYTSIGRIVLEQSLLGRLLNYGTIILVSTAEWGAEYYARALAAGAERKGVLLGAGYARILKEASRDPGKCLYGVRNPRKVVSTIEAKLQARSPTRS
jgi:hypothetical protein